MAKQDILSQDEIDALLQGVENGTVDTNTGVDLRDGVVREIDLTTHERIVRGRMPTLEMINNRFCRNLRVSLFNFLQRGVEVSFQGVRLMNFSDHVQTLSLPTSLSMIRMPPLRGSGLFVVNPPYTLPQALGECLPVLVERLGQGRGAGQRLDYRIP